MSDGRRVFRDGGRNGNSIRLRLFSSSYWGLAHGVDQYSAGSRRLITGEYNETLTSQLLQKTGMTAQTADLLDNSLSMVNTMGGAAAIQRARYASSTFRLPKSTGGFTEPVSKTSLPKMGSGGTLKQTSKGGTFGGAYNRAAHELYKANLRAQMEVPYVKDQNLGTFFEKLYRPNAKLGNGSTSAAIRYESATGKQLHGRLHFQKGQNSVSYLNRWLKNNPTASPGDRAAAENVLKDLQNSMGY